MRDCVSRQRTKPIFIIIELGIPITAHGHAQILRTRACIDAIERDGVPLAAIWVWHVPWQPDLTVSSATHPALIKRIADFNRKHAAIR
jgi:hypothetical protein